MEDKHTFVTWYLNFVSLHFTVEDKNKKLEGAIRKASSLSLSSYFLLRLPTKLASPLNLNKKSVFARVIFRTPAAPQPVYDFLVYTSYPRSSSNDIAERAFSLLLPPSQSFLTGKVCLELKVKALLLRFDSSQRGISVERGKVGCLYSLRNPLAIPFG